MRGRSRQAWREKRRLLRQFAALERSVPMLRGVLRPLLQDRLMLLRVPLSILCVIGGLLSFLPFLGIWLLPLGILLLAVDVPALRPLASGFTIRSRRWVTLRLRRIAAWTGRRRGRSVRASLARVPVSRR